MARTVTKKPWEIWEYWSLLEGGTELAIGIPIEGTPRGSFQSPLINN
ncbi:hypothetical protein QUB05_21175 [Microcoleus sp. F10-C6]